MGGGNRKGERKGERTAKEREGVGGREKQRTHGSPRGELNPIFRVLGGDEFVPRTHCLIQARHIGVRHVSKHTSVIAVPPHCMDVSECIVL